MARLTSFSELPRTSLDRLAALLDREEHRAGETIYQRNSAADQIFAIGRGRVEVVTVDESGRERVVNTLGTGASFGNVGFLRGGPRLATVRAATDVVLYMLHRAAFETLEGQLGQPSEGRSEATPGRPAAAKSEAPTAA